MYIAYASSDEARAQRLHDALVKRCRVFFAKASLRPGDAWMDRVPEAQRRSRMTVVLLSDTQGDAWSRSEEVARAVNLCRTHPRRHRVVPIFLDGAPTDLTGVPYGLGRIHGLDAAALGVEGVVEALSS